MCDKKQKNYLSSVQETLEKRKQQEIQRLKMEMENCEKVLYAGIWGMEIRGIFALPGSGYSPTNRLFGKGKL